MLTLETTRSHTDALKQGKQHSHYFMLAAASAVQSNLCHKSTGAFTLSHISTKTFHTANSRDKTFQCVTTRHVPWCLSLHPSRIWALGSVLSPLSSTSQERVTNSVIQPLMNSCSVATSELAATMVSSEEFVCASSKVVTMWLFASFLYVSSESSAAPRIRACIWRTAPPLGT